MSFQCNGLTHHLGVFATFDNFRDFRSWACTSFALGTAEGSPMHVYNISTQAWQPVVYLHDKFRYAPKYQINIPQPDGLYKPYVVVFLG